MKQRFVTDHRTSATKQILLSVLLFFAVFFCFTLALTSVSRQTTVEEQQALEQALQRDITSCYAIEGRYPASLQYIEDNYGLTYDKSRYRIDYQPLGANIFPEYTIIFKGGSAR